VRGRQKVTRTNRDQPARCAVHVRVTRLHVVCHAQALVARACQLAYCPRLLLHVKSVCCALILHRKTAVQNNGFRVDNYYGFFYETL